MKLVEIDWNPTSRKLRQFGGICAFALPGLGWLWGGSNSVIGGLAVVGVALAILGLVWPRGIQPVFLAMMIVAIPVGLVLGELGMLCVYFGVFLPIGIIFRLMRRDALQLKTARSSASYWQAKSQPRDATRYYRQT
ncbi:hypothetical protein [Symmachiella dynata]|uniref:hypothetical protein n=1 Tax=Symmachiella dynata TaxID=2527995 RepID=UPI0030EB5857